MHNSTLLLPVWFAIVFCLGGVPLVLADDKPTPQQYEAWITDLGDADYSKREFALVQLNLRKAEAIPFVISGIELASGEQADHLFQFLSSIASDPNDQDGALAYKALSKLAGARTTSKASRAQKILQVIGLTQREVSLESLHKVGVVTGDRMLQVMSSRILVRNALVIDERFIGRAYDLQCLKWLSQVEFARLEGPSIDKAVLTAVLALPDLKRLQIVDTQLSRDDISVLRDAPDLDLLEFVYAPFGDEAIPLLREIPVWGDLNLFGTALTLAGKEQLKAEADAADIFVSRGGFLGVQCQPTSVLIEEAVQNGAADLAHLRRGDRLLSINGIKISIFEDLRRELANFAAGEEVTIEYERDKEVFTVPVTLRRRTDLLNQ